MRSSNCRSSGCSVAWSADDVADVSNVVVDVDVDFGQVTDGDDAESLKQC